MQPRYVDGPSIGFVHAAACRQTFVTADGHFWTAVRGVTLLFDCSERRVRTAITTRTVSPEINNTPDGHDVRHTNTGARYGAYTYTVSRRHETYTEPTTGTTNSYLNFSCT